MQEAVPDTTEAVTQPRPEKPSDNIIYHDVPIEERIMSIFSEQWPISPPPPYERNGPAKRSLENDSPPPIRGLKRRQTLSATFQREELENPLDTPATQQALLLHAPKEKYCLSQDYPVPTATSDGEVLVRIDAIGLNPIDWKSADFGFGIPELPYISGRDFAGVVIQNKNPNSRLRVGDVVFAASTDYRDLRKSAYQQFAVAKDVNTCRVPASLPKSTAASLGVAFVAAALALGICCGVDFSVLSGKTAGPDLLATVRSLDESSLPKDVVEECHEGMKFSERPQKGEWIAIWGGSSTTALIAAQLAKLSGMRIISVVDVSKHGARLSERGVDLLVDNHDPERAVSIIRSVTGGKLRFAMDTIGKETATSLLDAVNGFSDNSKIRGHLVGLSGVPKEPKDGVLFHSVPVKLFHEINTIGESLMVWLEALLVAEAISPPDVTVLSGGLAAVNEGLQLMRAGEISGRRLVVQARQ